jgi:hypothetical protein
MRSDGEMEGFGNSLYHDYFILGIKKALDYIKNHKLCLEADNTTVAGVDMVVFRPGGTYNHPMRDRKPGNFSHRSQECCNGKCFFCGAPSDSWKRNEDCPAFVAARTPVKQNRLVRAARKVFPQQDPPGVINKRPVHKPDLRDEHWRRLHDKYGCV